MIKYVQIKSWNDGRQLCDCCDKNKTYIDCYLSLFVTCKQKLLVTPSLNCVISW